MKALMVTLFSCALMACAVDLELDEQLDDESLASDEQTVIGGVVDNGDPCVIALFVHPPGGTSGQLCTCTVIAPRTCLTAAHCVDPRFTGAGQVFELIGGTTLTLPGIVASSTLFHPQWNPNNLFAGHDIGIVHTANPMPFPTCARGNVNLAAPQVRIVGYGSNTHANTGAGTKRQATTNIVAASAQLIQVGNSNTQTCHGDSGGPVFQSIGGVQTVVGVTSFGQDQSTTSVCFGGGFHGRVNANAAFINANTF